MIWLAVSFPYPTAAMRSSTAQAVLNILRAPPRQKVVVMPDYFVDRVVTVPERRSLTELLKEKIEAGGGSIHHMSQVEVKGGNAVNLGYALAKLGVRTEIVTIAEGISKVLLQEFGEVKAVALFFDPVNGPGYVLFKTNGRVGKGVPTGGEEAEFVEGLGAEAYWLTGLRLVQYENLYGDVIYESRRITDQNTLIWSRDGFVFRIEGPLEKEAAVEIAESLR